MIKFDYAGAHKFVASANDNIFWRGWDMIFFKPDQRAIRNRKGVRRGERWGFETTVRVNRHGQWTVSPGLIKRVSSG